MVGVSVVYRRGTPHRSDKFRRSLRLGTAHLAQAMKSEAIALTSGGISTAELRARGHPFGRGARRSTRLRIPTPLLPINLQSGRLQRSLRVFRRQAQGEHYLQLQFTAPQSKYVLRPGGTTKMVDRGFWKAMRARYHQIKSVATPRVA